MESIWKNRKFSLFGPFWDTQIAFGFGAGLTGSKGTTFGKANFETQFCKIGLGLSPFRKNFSQKDRSPKIMGVGKKFPKCAGFRPCAREMRIYARALHEIGARCSKSKNENSKSIFGAYMKSKFLILTSTPPKTGAKKSIYDVKK